MIDTKIGGQGNVREIQRQYVNPNHGGGGDQGMSEILKGVNNIAQSVGAFAVKQKVTRDAEDRIDMQNTAHDESQDVSNAMQGASYDPDLNPQVEQWKADGVTTTQLRLNIRDYKWNKAIKDFDLENVDDAGENATIFFDTFNSLELKEIEPLATKDRENLKTSMMNKISSSFLVGNAPLADRLKDAEELSVKYGVTADQITAIAVSSAFTKARRGDTSDLEALETATNKNGVRLIDTIAGSEMYTKMSDAKLVRERNEVAQLEQDTKKAQVQVTESLYTQVVTGDDLETTQTKIDISQEKGLITMPQHATLTKTNRLLQASSRASFPDKSTPAVYSELRAKAQMGVLSQEELLTFTSELSADNFKTLVDLSIQKGGAFGLDDEKYTAMDVAIKNFGKDNSGLDLTGTIVSDLEGLKLGRKRESMLQERLRADKYQFILDNDRLPDAMEFKTMKAEVLDYVNTNLGDIDNTGGVTEPTTLEYLVPKMNVATPAERVKLYSKLSAQDQVRYKELLKAQIEANK